MRVVSESNVYVIGSEGGPYKIGIAGDLRVRLSGIQTGSHTKVSVMFSIQVPAVDAPRIERRAHQVLEEFRLLGEWFETSLEHATLTIMEASAYIAAQPKAVIEPDRARKPKRDGSDINKVVGLEVSHKVTDDEFLSLGRKMHAEKAAKANLNPPGAATGGTDCVDRIAAMVQGMTKAGAPPPKELSRLIYAILKERLSNLIQNGTLAGESQTV
jgi:hypothetical protein